MNVERTTRQRKATRTRADELSAVSSQTSNIPPQALDVEAAVLGSMMLDDGCVDMAMDSLTIESFYDRRHQAIFEAMKSLYAERSPIDLLTVTERLKAIEKLELVGGPAKLAALTSQVGSGAKNEYYLRILQEKSIQRGLIAVAYDIIGDAFDPKSGVDGLMKMAQDGVLGVISGNIKNPYKPVSDVVMRSMDRIQAVQTMEGTTGVPSGFHKLDKFTMGWQEGNLIILGARPSVGKTAFALNLARNAAVDFNVPVGFFSCEMTDMELTDRLLATESGIPADKLKGKVKMDNKDWQILEQSVGRLSKAPLYIDETPGITLTEFTAKASRMVKEHKVKIIFVDYLQLMHSTRVLQSGFSRVQEVTDISNTLKTTAKELKIPIIALAQLNRNLMARPGSNGRPVLSDLKDSGSIEQDADMVIFLHRPGLLGLSDDPEEIRKAEVIIAKNRNGKIGSVDMVYNGDLLKFEDADDTLIASFNQMPPPQQRDTQMDYNPFDDFERDRSYLG